jgi:tetratricopeptide (TPR) repeat protein
MSPNALFTPDLQVAGTLRESAQGIPLQEEFSSGAGDSIRQLMADVLERLNTANTTSQAPPCGDPLRTDDVELRMLAARLIDALGADDPAAKAEACLKLATWADKRDALKTSSWFVAAAAAFKPADASIAVRAGNLSRRQADYAAAQEWLSRAIEVAKATGASDALADAYAALGFVQRKLGNFGIAAESHLAAARIARKNQLVDREARAYHNLAVLSFELDKPHDGVSYGRKALDAYGRDRARILILANDLAWVWMDHDGAYRRALSIFQECLRSIAKPTQRIVVLGNAARAAAGAGDEAAFESMVQELHALLPESPLSENHAQGLLELAKGAALLKYTRTAEDNALRALGAARQRQENALVKEAEDLLTELRGGSPRPVRGAPATSEQADERLTDLVTDLFLTLR